MNARGARELPLPKYYVVRESIRAMISSEELREGDPIPSERELCERYGVSRMTTRQAVMDLVREGLLYRQQGRGTFVAGPRLHQEAARLTSFTQDMAERGMEVSSTVLELSTESASPMLSRTLGIDPSEKVIRLKRLRNADSQPMALETSYLVYSMAHSVLEADLSSGSLYEMLRQEGLTIARAEQSYEAALVDEQEAGYLGVAPGSPALRIERITYDATDTPFEYVRSTYRGDRYRITTTLHP